MSSSCRSQKKKLNVTQNAKIEHLRTRQEVGGKCRISQIFSASTEYLYRHNKLLSSLNQSICKSQAFKIAKH